MFFRIFFRISKVYFPNFAQQKVALFRRCTIHDICQKSKFFTQILHKWPRILHLDLWAICANYQLWLTPYTNTHSDKIELSYTYGHQFSPNIAKLAKLRNSAFQQPRGWVALPSIVVRRLFVVCPAWLHLLLSPLYEVLDHTNLIFSERTSKTMFMGVWLANTQIHVKIQNTNTNSTSFKVAVMPYMIYF